MMSAALLAQPAPETGGKAPGQSPGWYQLQPGDSIEIRFFYNQELNESVMIRPDGYISMPLIGEVLVAGKTVSQLEGALRSAYKGIVRKPELTIQIRGYANRKVYVGGEVAHPGVLDLVGKQTALSAIMQSGGLLMSANRSQAVVIRKGKGGSPVSTVVSLKRKGAAPQAASFELRPFDIVIVDRSGIAKANQAIEQYVKRMIPVTLSAGFLYVFNNRSNGLVVNP